LELLIGESGEVFIEAAEDLVPGFERGVAEEFFVGHGDPLSASLSPWLDVRGRAGMRNNPGGARVVD
jgi:hypothetical protein